MGTKALAMSRDTARREATEIFLGGGAKAQHNPWEAVSPVIARKAGPVRGLHVTMKPLEKSVALWVIGFGTEEFPPQDDGDHSPKLRCELRNPVRGKVGWCVETGHPSHNERPGKTGEQLLATWWSCPPW